MHAQSGDQHKIHDNVNSIQIISLARREEAVPARAYLA
jgi:hypothetical protein